MSSSEPVLDPVAALCATLQSGMFAIKERDTLGEEKVRDLCINSLHRSVTYWRYETLHPISMKAFDDAYKLVFQQDPYQEESARFNAFFMLDTLLSDLQQRPYIKGDREQLAQFFEKVIENLK